MVRPFRSLHLGVQTRVFNALGQVVNFAPTREISLERLQISLNGMLPPDVAVKNADYVAPDFHARFDALPGVYSSNG